MNIQSSQLELYHFCTQVTFSAMVAIFCMCKLTLVPVKGKVNESLYSSILTGIVGYWLPSPGSRKNSSVSVDSETTNITAGEQSQK